MELNKSSSFTEVHEDLNLYTTKDKFYLQPIQFQNVILEIDRLTNEKRLQQNVGQIPTNASKREICGILGEIKLIAGPYLIIVTKKQRIGPIGSHSIYQIKETEVIPLCRSLLHLNQTQMTMNRRYLNMIENVLDTPYFYFSYTYDITHTMQRLFATTPNFLNIPMHERADKRFLWNYYLLTQFCSRIELAYFCLPIIHGYVSVNPYTILTNIGSTTFLWTIISRRSCDRAGTRLFRRGIDHNGNVANYVETEQIIEYEGNRSSFVQIRGSIPLFWNQYPNLHLKSPINIVPYENHIGACNKQFEDLIAYYNEVVLVNLIDHHGSEGKLERKFKELVNDIGSKKIRYEAYDFHCECKNMQWHKLDRLIDRLSPDQDKFKYLFVQSDGRLRFSQIGVFRTNCIDCLDRTNVVQSMLAWRNLKDVFQELHFFPNNEGVEIPEEFHKFFKGIWADHADCISIQYSGASALKTDFTRSGKRTYLGILNDGFNTLLRYYKNNLKDGVRQDAVDLFLGTYRIQDGEALSVKCPIDTVPSWKYVTFSVIFLMAISMFFANAIFANEYSTGTLLFLFFWASMITVTWLIIMHYGNEFVDYPKLQPLKHS